MSKKRKPLVKSVDHDLEDKESYANLPDDERKYDLGDGTMVTAREWKRQFDNEYYTDSRFGKHRIMKDDEMKKDAIRTKNSIQYYDTLSVAERNGSLVELTDNEEEFMQQASDEWEWQDVYKYHGPKEAKRVIFEQAKKEIEVGAVDIDVTLSRFAIKMFKLKTFNERKRKQKGNKDEK